MIEVLSKARQSHFNLQSLLRISTEIGIDTDSKWKKSFDYSQEVKYNLKN